MMAVCLKSCALRCPCRGNVVGSLSAMPSKGICFLSFEWIKNLIAKDRKLSDTELLVAGAAAGAITEVGASGSAHRLPTHLRNDPRTT